MYPPQNTIRSFKTLGPIEFPFIPNDSMSAPERRNMVVQKCDIALATVQPELAKAKADCSKADRPEDIALCAKVGINEFPVMFTQACHDAGNNRATAPSPIPENYIRDRFLYYVNQKINQNSK